MNLRLSLLALSMAVFASCPAFAQAPAGAPAGATGQCKDGSYWTGASKSGACRGHKGIQTWYAASNAKPAPGTAAPPSANVAAKPAPGATPTPKPAPTPPIKPTNTFNPPAKAVPGSGTPAPGGGNGQVWVNAETKVYHCQGDRYYGTTKNGKYMSEADAQKMGAHASRGKPCSAK
ncbi:MAG TPA: DUF3761 domain-containing protein [Acidobacteriaceae bacterium]|nr:DUF3761 domain-containing protein [Acidobacteriaceae bacterium]